MIIVKTFRSYMLAASSLTFAIGLPIPQMQETNNNEAQGEHFVENLILGEKISDKPGYLLFTAPYKICEGECNRTEDNFLMAFPLYVGERGIKQYKSIYSRDFSKIHHTKPNAPFKQKSPLYPFTLCPDSTTAELTTTETSDPTEKESTTEETKTSTVTSESNTIIEIKIPISTTALVSQYDTETYIPTTNEVFTPANESAIILQTETDTATTKKMPLLVESTADLNTQIFITETIMTTDASTPTVRENKNIETPTSTLTAELIAVTETNTSTFTNTIDMEFDTTTHISTTNEMSMPLTKPAITSETVMDTTVMPTFFTESTIDLKTDTSTPVSQTASIFITDTIITTETIEPNVREITKTELQTSTVTADSIAITETTTTTTPLSTNSIVDHDTETGIVITDEISALSTEQAIYFDTKADTSGTPLYLTNLTTDFETEAHIPTSQTISTFITDTIITTETPNPTIRENTKNETQGSTVNTEPIAIKDFKTPTNLISTEFYTETNIPFTNEILTSSTEPGIILITDTDMPTSKEMIMSLTESTLDFMTETLVQNASKIKMSTSTAAQIATSDIQISVETIESITIIDTNTQKTRTQPATEYDMKTFDSINNEIATPPTSPADTSKRTVTTETSVFSKEFEHTTTKLPLSKQKPSHDYWNTASTKSLTMSPYFPITQNINIIHIHNCTNFVDSSNNRFIIHEINVHLHVTNTKGKNKVIKNTKVSQENNATKYLEQENTIGEKVTTRVIKIHVHSDEQHPTKTEAVEPEIDNGTNFADNNNTLLDTKTKSVDEFMSLEKENSEITTNKSNSYNYPSSEKHSTLSQKTYSHNLDSITENQKNRITKYHVTANTNKNSMIHKIHIYLHTEIPFSIDTTLVTPDLNEEINYIKDTTNVKAIPTIEKENHKTTTSYSDNDTWKSMKKQITSIEHSNETNINYITVTFEEKTTNNPEIDEKKEKNIVIHEIHIYVHSDKPCIEKTETISSAINNITNIGITIKTGLETMIPYINNTYDTTVLSPAINNVMNNETTINTALEIMLSDVNYAEDTKVVSPATNIVTDKEITVNTALDSMIPGLDYTDNTKVISPTTNDVTNNVITINTALGTIEPDFNYTDDTNVNSPALIDVTNNGKNINKTLETMLSGVNYTEDTNVNSPAFIDVTNNGININTALESNSPGISISTKYTKNEKNKYISFKTNNYSWQYNSTEKLFTSAEKINKASIGEIPATQRNTVITKQPIKDTNIVIPEIDVQLYPVKPHSKETEEVVPEVKVKKYDDYSEDVSSEKKPINPHDRDKDKTEPIYETDSDYYTVSKERLPSTGIFSLTTVTGENYEYPDKEDINSGHFPNKDTHKDIDTEIDIYTYITDIEMTTNGIEIDIPLNFNNFSDKSTKKILPDSDGSIYLEADNKKPMNSETEYDSLEPLLITSLETYVTNANGEICPKPIRNCAKKITKVTAAKETLEETYDDADIYNISFE